MDHRRKEMTDLLVFDQKISDIADDNFDISTCDATLGRCRREMARHGNGRDFGDESDCCLDLNSLTMLLRLCLFTNV